MTSYFIGIDNGSQSSKVTIFDDVGSVVSEGRCRLRPNDTPRPGIVEHPDDDLWTSISEASRRAMAGFAGDPADIVGVGLCTIRFCRALLAEDGSLARPVMSWMDDRVSHPHEQDDLVRYVTTSSGYITHRMTGELKDTAANYQGAWPVDTDTWEWSADDAEIASFGVTRDMLLELVQPGEVLGEVTQAASRATGIPAGLPVVATANDKAVEALGCGLRAPGSLLVSLGTYIAGMTTGRRNVRDASSFWSNFACDPGAYLYESVGIRRGMWTVSWVRDLLGDEMVRRAEERGLTVENYLNLEAASVPAGCDGLLTVLDWLAPADAPHRKGSILGLDARHGRLHLYRSVLEGIALTLSRTCSAMADELGERFTQVVVSGGGSGSDLMMQIVADVFGLPSVRPQVSDAAGLGAAVCAAVGLGRYRDIDEAVDAMVRVGATFAPDPERQRTYRDLASVHRDAAGSTDALYRKSFALFG